jgi:hypothetical protein
MWKQDGAHLWALCSKLVAQSGSPLDVLQKHLPLAVALETEFIQQKDWNFLKHLPNQNLYYGFTQLVACVGELPYSS